MEENKTIEMENDFTVAADYTEYLHTISNEEELTTLEEYVPSDTMIDQSADELMMLRLFTSNVISQRLEDANWQDVFKDRVALTQDIETVLNLFHIIISDESDEVPGEITSFVDDMLGHVNINSPEINYKPRENMTERDVTLLKLTNIYQVLTAISNTATIMALKTNNVDADYPVQYLVSPVLLLPDDVSTDDKSENE